MRGRPWLAVVGTIVLVALTAIFVDLDAVVAQLAGLSWWPLALALALSIPQLAVTAWRWHFTAARMGLPIPLSVAWREYYVSTLLNQVLPGGVVGDASRVVRLAANVDDGAGKVARCVVIERASGQLALWLIIVVGVAVGALGVGGHAVVSWAPWVLAGLLSAGAGLGLAARSRWIRRSRVGAVVAEVGQELRAAMLSRGAWAVQLSTSLVAVGLLAAMFTLCVAAVGAPVRAEQVLLVAPLVLAASALPVSVGGWGVREATAAGLFELMGLSAASGAAASAAFGAVSLVSATPGAVLWFVAPRLKEPA